MADRKPLVVTADFFPGELDNADRLDVSGIITSGDIAMGGNKITGLASGTATDDAATFGQLQAALAGRDAKDNVVVVSVANETLSGLPTIDGVSLTSGQRVLLTAQTTASENGIWEVSAGAWTRPSDFATGSSAEGAYISVSAGTTYEGTMWVAVADSPSDIVDTDDPNFIQMPSSVTAGDGLVLTGSVLSIDLAANSGLQFTGGDLDLLLKDSTLAKDALGLFVQGVPANFTINGIATGATVTAANLDTLTNGSDADALHTHSLVEAAKGLREELTAVESIAIGDPVEWSTTADQIQKCQAAVASKVDCFGVAIDAISAAGTGTVIRRGIAPGVLVGATPGDRYYLGATGGLSTTPPVGVGNNIVLIGTAKNATDLEVHPQYMGRKAI